LFTAAAATTKIYQYFRTYAPVTPRSDISQALLFIAEQHSKLILHISNGFSFECFLHRSSIIPTVRLDMFFTKSIIGKYPEYIITLIF